jgi:uncharacterized protein YcfL
MKKVSFLFLSMLMLSGLNAEVKIGGNNEQKVTVQNGVIGNSAVGVMSKATQNVASNKGKVKIGGNNKQEVTVKNGVIGNSAVGVMSKAEQNIASNEGN